MQLFNVETKSGKTAQPPASLSSCCAVYSVRCISIDCILLAVTPFLISSHRLRRQLCSASSFAVTLRSNTSFQLNSSAKPRASHVLSLSIDCESGLKCFGVSTAFFCFSSCFNSYSCSYFLTAFLK